jgi:RNA polymerase sigma factor (sigma-70 family)
MKISVLVKAKNNFLTQFLAENNLNQAELAKLIGIHASIFGDMLNFRWIPVNQVYIKRLEEFFHVPIEDIFPPELTREIASELSKKYLIEKEIDITYLPSIQHLQIPYTENFDEALQHQGILSVIETLSTREQQIIKGRFGIDSAEKSAIELADELQVTSSRVHQIEAKAMRKLKHWSRMPKLRNIHNGRNQPPEGDLCYWCIYLTDPTTTDKRWKRNEYGYCLMNRCNHWNLDTCNYFLQPHPNRHYIPTLFYRRQSNVDLYNGKIFEQYKDINNKTQKDIIASMDLWDADKKKIMDSLHSKMKTILSEEALKDFNRKKPGEAGK